MTPVPYQVGLSDPTAGLLTVALLLVGLAVVWSRSVTIWLEF